MTPRADPYRVLGLVLGATPGEIRSAYRRLAKLHHPDKAGERSLQRFLAIQAAYEELLDADGRLRVRGWPTRGGAGGAGRAPNPDAKGASRDAWRARRAGGRSAEAGSAGSPGGGAARATGRDAGGPGGAASAGAGSAGAKARPKAGAKSSADPEAGAASGRGDGAASGSGRRGRQGASEPPGAGAGQRSGGRARSERRTARPGSTTYDEAAQPLDPSWEGAAWYGASSGRYWTLNPREYADPRKHGPEYQERARRAARLEAALRARRAARTATGPEPAPGDGEPTPDASAEPGPTGAAAAAGDAGPSAGDARRRARRPAGPVEP